MPRFTILVVEDFPGYREFVCRELQQNAEFDVFAVADGLSAVEKAQELRPDLVLLDIGLPGLNGIEAGEQIRMLCPESTILFLTQESSVDFVEAALATGSHGYIHKLRAHGCLLAAVEAMLEGRSSARDCAMAAADSNARAPQRHMVHFYSDDGILVESTERFVASALKAQDAAVVLATKPHLEMLVQRLKCDGVNVERAVEEGTFRPFDAREILSQIMPNGVLDSDLFRTVLHDVVQSAAQATKQPDPRVAIFGECVALLCASDNVDAAMRLEQAGNEMVAQCGTPAVDIMCGYPLPHPAFRRICAEHSVVTVR